MHSLRLPDPGLLGVLFVLVFVAPFLDLPFSRKLQGSPTAAGRMALYRWIAAYLWVLAGVCWAVRDGAGWRVPHTSGDLTWMFAAPWRAWLTGALVTAFFVLGLMPGIACLLQPRRIPAYTRAMQRLRWFLPHDTEQRRMFALLSVTAGVCEEWIFRGFVLHGLHAGMGFSLTMALVLSSALFGWNHLYQGWMGIGTTGGIGLAMGLVALLTGGLAVPMVLHALMDLQALVSFRPEAEAAGIAQAAGRSGRF